MADFLFHSVSEKEKENIKKEAKQILDRFHSSIKKIKSKEGSVEREGQLRDEGKKQEKDSGFRKIIFKNAPKKQGDYFLAEKAEWK